MKSIRLMRVLYNNKDKTELIIIPEGKKSVTVFGNVDFSKSELSPFNSKRNLEEIVLLDGIKEIPADTFNSCTGLQKSQFQKV